jgi:hypothetical protein
MPPRKCPQHHDHDQKEDSAEQVKEEPPKTGDFAGLRSGGIDNGLLIAGAGNKEEKACYRCYGEHSLRSRSVV